MNRVFKLALLTIICVMPFVTQAQETVTQPNLEPHKDWQKPVEDSHAYGLFLSDLLEYKGGSEKTLNWDIIGWRGTDIHRIWIKSEGESSTEVSDEKEADFQILYGRLISPYFDAQLGLRYEQKWNNLENPSRYFLAMGIQGLALYMFEIDAAFFIAQQGDLSARLTASEDFLLTQKLISQIRFESNAASRRSEKFEVGSGLNDLSLGIRFRYEFVREFAPYIGVNWTQLFGETADFSRLRNKRTSETSAVAGLRFWF